MADAVREALERASCELREDAVRSLITRLTAAEAKQLAAAAIVAFLRALPDGYVEIEHEYDGIRYPRQLGMTSDHAQLLAASVARAAEEGRDERP